MQILKSKKLLGFTLIELLIVIAIIGVLAVAFLPSLLGAPAKARDAQRIATVGKIQTFLVSNAIGSGVYPTSGCIDPSTVVTPGTPGTIGPAIYAKLSESFGGVIPVDPGSANSVTLGGCATAARSFYYYFTGATGTPPNEYAIYADIENTAVGNVTCPTAAVTSMPVLSATGAAATCYAVTGKF